LRNFSGATLFGHILRPVKIFSLNAVSLYSKRITSQNILMDFDGCGQPPAGLDANPDFKDYGRTC
jgi:hypothetical protein